MILKEVNATEDVVEQLISLSEYWEKENSCHGYQKNTLDDIKGNRIFLAVEDNIVIGYLLGHKAVAEKATSVYQADTNYFEIEELYVIPAFRNKGIGKRLFEYVEREVAAEVDMIMLSTATKNFRAILHFYIDELGMEFWSARLFKKLR
ncbi:MAG: GNAT family N-acetyltransferase [Lachnospiraceae bacterium]|nr:GNAT family N-acetyltransferase [Lachnospiraceae bacterium]